MADKFKKIAKTFVLSDSSVNCYGYRLLTNGYIADKYLRNPIGYLMHKRESGVLLKWEDIRTEGDQILGVPVINLSHPRGQQTVDEVESGFLNAASMGRIVPVEVSDDPSLMLEGQTLPTVVKWYNKECSLVDMPGNDNALAQLYDEQDNELSLQDLADNFLTKIPNNNMQELKLQITADLIKHLNLNSNPDAAAVLKGIGELADKASKYDAAVAKVTQLETVVKDLKETAVAKEVKTLLDKGLADGKLTNELVTELSESYKDNPAGLKSLIDKMPAYQSVTDQLSNGEKSKDGKKFSDLSWKELDKAGYLEALKSKNPELYKQKYKDQFGKEPKG